MPGTVAKSQSKVKSVGKQTLVTAFYCQTCLILETQEVEYVEQGWVISILSTGAIYGKHISVRGTDKGTCGIISIADVCSGEGFPQGTLVPVCKGVDDLMKMSHFACQII